MAALELDINKIVDIFREIVKRKTTYNETNLHYEYYKRAGDTIPYKAHGFDTLRELIQKNAGDAFYFERVGNDLEFIAPKRSENSLVYSDVSKEPQKITVVKKINNYSGTDSSKRIRVSNNIHFGQPQSTGMNNPFQNIRNDIKISFDFNVQRREVGQKYETSTPNDESESSANLKHVTSEDEFHSDTYSLARNKSEHMDVDDEEDDEFPWDNKYWHLKITHAVSTNVIWARFFDEFEARFYFIFSFFYQKICLHLIFVL